MDLPGVRAAANRIAALEGVLPPNWIRRLEVAAGVIDADLGSAYGWLVRVFSDREKRNLFRNEIRSQLSPGVGSPLSRWANDPAAGRALADRVCFTDINSYLPDDLLVKMDLATMIHSLESRSRFLDHHVLELAATIPAALRHPQCKLKWMLKEAFRDSFPPGFMDRPKSGFGIPAQEWFRGSLANFCREHLTSSDTRIHAYFERSTITRMVDQHVSGRISWGYQLWALLMLELWHREVVDG
jgi:asparagine synthase (glutamine-hydrolysing)